MAHNINLKKPPLSTEGTLRSRYSIGKKGNVTATDDKNTKKGDLQSSVPYPSKSAEIDSNDFENVDSIPTSIAVHSSTRKKCDNEASGHTLLCKPLPVNPSKNLSQETVSNLSGGAISSIDEDGTLCDSHSQMRKLPPLTDHMDDETESGIGEGDKYATMEVPSNIDYSDDSSNAGENIAPVAVKKKTKFRSAGLAAFRPTNSGSSKNKYLSVSKSSEIDDSASEATTAITAHTRKSISFLRDPKRNRVNASRRSLPSNKSSISSTSNGTRRFAALKARVRARKV